MSLLSERTVTDLSGEQVNTKQLLTNEVVLPMLVKLPPLKATSLEVGPNQLKQISNTMIVNANSVNCTAANMQITGALTVMTDTVTTTVALPDAIGDSHILQFQNGLLTNYSLGLFQFVIDSTQSGYYWNSFQLPLVSNGVYDMTVTWGDGTSSYISAYNSPSALHNYTTTPGLYTITIYGKCWGFNFNGGGDCQKMIDIERWGPEFQFTIPNDTNNYGFFRGCSNLNISATNKPNFTNTTDLTSMFENCSSLNPADNNINGWDVTGIAIMNSMFRGCTSFNANISSWVASSCIDFSYMFEGCSQFNRPLTNLVKTDLLPNPKTCKLNGMFSECVNFNSSMANWKTDKVDSMSNMFFGCTNFNQNIGFWNVSGCTNFSNMFKDCLNFNNGGSSVISQWQPSNAVNMESMFQNCTGFNQPMNYNSVQNYWNVSKVTNFTNMFNNAQNFNQNIGLWPIAPYPAQVTMESMFQDAFKFNNGQTTTVPGVTPALTTYNIGTNRLTCSSASFTTTVSVGNTLYIVVFDNVFTTTVASIVDNQNITLNPALVQNYGAGLIYNVSLAPGTGTNNMEWEFSGVVTCKSMFVNCYLFNQYLIGSGTSVDFGTVTTFESMFENAYSFNNGNAPGGSTNEMKWTVSSSLFDMQKMFVNCYSLNSKMTRNLGFWNTSSVVYMNATFLNCRNFNQNIGGWSVSSCINFEAMFSGAYVFNNGGSTDIQNWSASTYATNFVNMFNSAYAFNQPLTNLVNSTGLGSNSVRLSQMFDTAKSFNNGQVTTVATVTPLLSDYNSSFNFITCPGANLLGPGVLAAGDRITIVAQTRTYVNEVDTVTSATTFTLKISMNITYPAGQIYNISKYANTLGNAPMNWRTERVYDTSNMFRSAGSFNQNLSQNGNYWQLQNVENAYNMFQNAYGYNNGDRVCSANIPLYWNVSSMKTTTYMFQDAHAFNQELRHPGTTNPWKSKSATSLTGMFYTAVQFNHGQFTNISVILPYNATYDDGTKTLTYPGAYFTVSAPTSLTIVTLVGTFTRNVASITNNDTIVLVTGLGTFLGINDIVSVSIPAAAVANKPLRLITDNVSSCSQMFQQAIMFNQELKHDAYIDDFGNTKYYWSNDVLSLSNSMFYYATTYNQPMAQFVTKNITNMSIMFQAAVSFNQPLVTDDVNGYWDVRNVINMPLMFAQAYAFKQSLASWYPSSCNNFFNFLFGIDINDPNSASNQVNYNALLNSWGNAPRLSDMQPNIVFGRGLASYTITVAGTARNNLITLKNWTFDPAGGGV